MIAGITLPIFAKYQYLLTFGIGGIPKFIPQAQQHMADMFPVFPRWFWYAVGIWEAGIAASYYLDYKVPSIYASYMLLGGVFWSTLAIKDRKHGKTQVQLTKGLILLPVSFPLDCFYQNTMLTVT